MKIRDQINFILALVVVFSGSSSFAQGEVGFYTGSFDPITIAHEQIIRSALKTKGVERLYVLVNVSGSKNFSLSGEERSALIRASIPDLADRVVIQPVLQETKEEKIRELAHGNTIVTFIGEDSFRTLPANAMQREATRFVVFGRGEGLAASAALATTSGASKSNARVDFVELPPLAGDLDPHTVSSTEVRKKLQATERSPFLNPEVSNLIKTHHLYETPRAESEWLSKRSSFIHAFVRTVQALAGEFPSYDFTRISIPEFKVNQSRSGWIESVLRAAIKSVVPTHESEQFWNHAHAFLQSGSTSPIVPLDPRLSRHLQLVQCEALFE